MSVDLTIDTGDTPPAAVQWTIRYSTDAIVSIDVIPGSAANDAAKLLLCNPTPGVITCIVYGINRSAIAGGVMATLAVTLAPDVTGSAAIALTDTVSADLSGSALATAASGGAIDVTPDTAAPRSAAPRAR